ncbi:MAG: oligosaccharide flippase family protein [Pyrinomonadaceae bacterium]
MQTEPVDKRKRFLRNSIFGVMSWLLPIVPTMIATPIVIKRLGDEQYGVLAAMLSFIAYFFTTAIGKVAAKYVAEYRATNQHEKISPMITATIIFGVATTLLLSLAAFVFARPIVVDALLIPAPMQEQAVTGIYIACTTILSIVLAQVFQFALQGIHRFDWYLLLANLTSVSFSLGSIAIVMFGYGWIALLAWNLVTWSIVGVVSYFAARRLIPECRLTLKIPSEIWRSVRQYAWGIIGYQLFGTLLLFFERVWILRNFGGEAMAYYVIPMTLALYLHLFTASLVLAMFPVVNELLDEPEKLKELYQKATKLVLTLLLFAVLSVVVGGKVFLTAWLGERYADECYVMLVIQTVTFTILALNTVAWQVAEGFRSASLNAYGTIVWMVVGITGMIFLSQTWQTNGVAGGRLVGVLVFIPLIFYIEKRFLDGIFWKFWGAAGIRILIAAMPAVGVELLLTKTLQPSWLSFFSSVAAGGIAYAVSLYIVGFIDEGEKKVARELLAKYR